MPGSGTPTPKMNIATFKDTDDFDFNDVNGFLATIDDLGMPDVVTSGTRPTTDLRNGRIIYETDTLSLVRYDTASSSWKYITRNNWQAWGPANVWKNGGTTNLGIGSGVLNGRYKQVGYDVEAQFELTRAADSNVGTSFYSWELPVAAAYPQGILGTATIVCAGAMKVAVAALIGSTTMVLYMTDTNSRVSNAVPGVWAANDSIAFSIKYRASAAV